MIKQGAHQDIPDWTVAFVPRPGSPSLAYRVRQLSPLRSEVFTGKLPYTKSYFAALRSGSLALLRRDGILRYEDTLDLLTFLATHNYIARTGEFDLAEPGYWVRVPYPEAHVLRGMRHVPVMPLDQLSDLSGKALRDMADLLRPLIEDGAIRVLRNRAGTDGILLNDGFVSTDRGLGILRP